MFQSSPTLFCCAFILRFTIFQTSFCRICNTMSYSTQQDHDCDHVSSPTCTATAVQDEVMKIMRSENALNVRASFWVVGRRAFALAASVLALTAAAIVLACTA